ncbi:MAG: glycosyltransferase [Christensenellales bacterium]
MEKISVLMSVYKNDRPEWLEIAIKSVANQTYKPNEIVLYVDGEVSDELNQKIESLSKEIDFLRVIRNEENLGLGLTLQKGIYECKNEIIARMDSDDYSLPNRFELQVKHLIDNNLDLVGSNVDEFINDINNVVSCREVPSSLEDIKIFAKSRSPFCHPSVMFRKSKVLESGNYQDMKLCEDYYLWVRMLQHNCKMENINQSLVRMRVSSDLYARRGGLKYYKSQKKLFKYMKDTKFINGFTYFKNKVIRFTAQVLLPNKLRQKLYEKKLRKN